MLKAVLFDLDDTLLANDMDVLLPHHLRMLGEYFAPFVEPSRFKTALLSGTRRMMESQDRSTTNHQEFWPIFENLSGMARSEAEPYLDRFYREKYPSLAGLTRPVPFARPLIESCLQRGLKVVIATNPLFPKRAIEERLRWAGLPAEELPYALVTCYESMHATKPALSYYEEILAKVGATPEATLMVGNDADADIAPAQRLGLQTIHVTNASAAPYEGAERRLSANPEAALHLPAPSGSLRAVWQQLSGGSAVLH
jgi:FMN phosphatase YigB (HAD superfamily)